jgi:hypothetical protein
VYFGKAQKLHHDFEDPAALTGSEEQRLALFRRVRDELRSYLRRFALSTTCTDSVARAYPIRMALKFSLLRSNSRYPYRRGGNEKNKSRTIFENLKGGFLRHLTHTRYISRKLGFSRRCPFKNRRGF